MLDIKTEPEWGVEKIVLEWLYSVMVKSHFGNVEMIFFLIWNLTTKDLYSKPNKVFLKVSNISTIPSLFTIFLIFRIKKWKYVVTHNYYLCLATWLGILLNEAFSSCVLCVWVATADWAFPLPRILLGWSPHLYLLSGYWAISVLLN